MSRERRLVVDWIKCDAHGLCAELVPELIELDDWGYPIVRPGGVPRGLMEHARRAVRDCPTLALLITEAELPAAPRKGAR